MDLNKEKPIFIGGSKRGGTTLLRKIISAHSKITIPPPGWFYHFIFPYLHTYGDLNKDKNILELIEDFLQIPLVCKYWNLKKNSSEILSLLPERSFRGVLYKFFNLYGKRFNTPLWGSKSPSNVFWFKDIYQDFPEAKFILLYRDGRDVSVDLVETYWGPSNLFSACLLWKSYTCAMIESKKYLKQNSFYEVYYEDLVENPQNTIKGICKFLNIKYESSMLKYYERNSDNFMKKEYHQKASKPITTKYVGIYKKLSLNDRQLQIKVIGDILKKLKYKIDVSPREIDFWEKEHYLEEDRHGGLILEGGVEYRINFVKRQLKRKEEEVW